MFVELIAIALAAALSPIIISAFTRVVFSEQRAVAVPAFVGTVGALSFLIPLIVGRTFGAATGYSDEDEATRLLDVLVATALAMLLFALAVKNLRKRGEPSGDEGVGERTDRAAAATAEGDRDAADAAAAVDAGSSLGLRGALGLGAAVVVLNPKSIALFVAAGDLIGTEAEAFAEAALAALVFALACVGPIAGVAVYQAVGGAPAAQRIASAEAWMTRNGPMIKAVVLGLIGAFFAYKAIAGIGKL